MAYSTTFDAQLGCASNSLALNQISIPKPVWAVGFAHEQTLRDATLAVFSFANFKTASA
ncbi:MAG: hypothetical protein LBH59_01595 [Planctomycetaceae bacterium]|nr:hypothetical protein [Planctomycetaceae bacterium]